MKIHLVLRMNIKMFSLNLLKDIIENIIKRKYIINTINYLIIAFYIEKKLLLH